MNGLRICRSKISWTKEIRLQIPDATVSAPLPPLFDALFHELRPCCLELDVLVALGSHPPMSDGQIARLLGIDETERRRLFFQMHFFNHEWDRPDRLLDLGSLTKAETAEITTGMLSRDVSVQINSRIRDFDLLLLLGPVFPGQFLGYSGGNEYLFPGIGGPDIINFLENLGGLIKDARNDSQKRFSSPSRHGHCGRHDSESEACHHVCGLVRSAYSRAVLWDTGNRLERCRRFSIQTFKLRDPGSSRCNPSRRALAPFCRNFPGKFAGHVP